MQDARPAGGGEPVLLGAHAEPQGQAQRQQGGAQFGEKRFPARFGAVDAALP